MIETVATLLFALAILHTFLVPFFQRMGNRFRPGSPGENFFHLLGEVEVVFGLWGSLFFLFIALREGTHSAVTKLEALHFEEAVFVFVIMAMSSTKPILDLARTLLGSLAALLPMNRGRSSILTLLGVGPLLGSFITEPAAMTVCSFLLLPLLRQMSERGKYLLLGLLFVNISLGGTLTHFAAPPILVVSRPWNWDSLFVFSHLGWRSVAILLVSTSCVMFFLRRELDQLEVEPVRRPESPLWNTAIHLCFLALVVMSSHHMTVLFALFLFFLGWVAVTDEYQDEVNLRSALLVGFFLSGLIALGSFQSWWIQPLVTALEPTALFLGATLLTAITDNALLTYLGTLAPEISETQKLALVSGAVCGGGLTVIANAPNPIGYSVLRGAFGEDGIRPLSLLGGALFPTLVGIAFFLL